MIATHQGKPMKAILTLLLMAFYSLQSSAALQPLSDDELSDQMGQAFLQIDRDYAGSMSYTKFTFGMDVDVSLNADLIEMGRYERSGEATGSSDIRINDFALGSVNDDGSLNPFSIHDPFFELAFETVGGQEQLVGVRLGFTEAFGKLSGNIEYLSGNIEVDLYGLGSYLATQMECGGIDLICYLARDVIVGGNHANDEFAGEAVLVNPSTGAADSIRATHIGMANGSTLSIPESDSAITDFLLGIFSSDNCELLSTQTCFPLSIYRTLDIGNKDTGEYATGMFVSFQSQPVSWFDGSGEGTLTTAGAFMNIPNGGIRTSFPEAFEGTQRIRTKFLDPYYD